MDTKVLLFLTAIATASIWPSVIHPSTTGASDCVVTFVQRYTDPVLTTWTTSVDLLFSTVCLPLKVILAVLHGCHHLLQYPVDGVVYTVDAVLDLIYVVIATVDGIIQYVIYKPLAFVMDVIQSVVAFPFKLISVDGYIRVLFDYVIQWPLEMVKDLLQAIVATVFGGVLFILKTTLAALHWILNFILYGVFEILCLPVQLLYNVFTYVSESLKTSVLNSYQKFLTASGHLFYMVLFPIIGSVYSFFIYLLIKLLSILVNLLFILLNDGATAAMQQNIRTFHRQRGQGMHVYHQAYAAVMEVLGLRTQRHDNVARLVRKEDDEAAAVVPPLPAAPEDAGSSECVVCFEEDAALVKTLPCGHDVTCLRCLLIIQRDSNRCPLCRAVIRDVGWE